MDLPKICIYLLHKFIHIVLVVSGHFNQVHGIGNDMKTKLIFSAVCGDLCTSLSPSNKLNEIYMYVNMNYALCIIHIGIEYVIVFWSMCEPREAGREYTNSFSART